MLHHAFMAEFSLSYRPVDVLLVGCLNDVMRGRTFLQIKEDLEKFKKDVISLKRAPEAGDKCTFAVSTPPYPPKVVALPSEERPFQENRFETIQSHRVYPRIEQCGQQFLRFFLRSPLPHLGDEDSRLRPQYVRSQEHHGEHDRFLRTTME